MKVGITGSRGLLGTHLIKSLQKTNEIVEFEGDITKQNDVQDFIRNDIDVIYHLASKIPKYDQSGKLIEQSFDSNVIGTQNIADFARESNSKVVFASTQKVYGNKSGKIILENDSLNPIENYEKSKLRSERILQEKLEPNKVTILRFSNIYGVYPKRISIIESISESIIFQKPIHIGLPDKTLRDYIHINDIVNAFVLSKNHFGIFNIGYGKSFSVKELIKLFKDISGMIPQLTFGKSASFDIILNCTKARKTLGFSPKVTIEEGIKETFFAVKNFNQ